jgi:hypothetical protein
MVGASVHIPPQMFCQIFNLLTEDLGTRKLLTVWLLPYTTMFFADGPFAGKGGDRAGREGRNVNFVIGFEKESNR